VYEGLDINLKFSIKESIHRRTNEYFKDDLFSTTRHRLTIFYSGLLMLFLLLFMIIGYSVFYAIMSSEQKQETAELAKQIQISNQVQFQNIVNQNTKNNKNIQITTDGQDAYFFYVFNKNNEFITGIDKNPILHNSILKTLNSFRLTPNVISSADISYGNDQNIYMQMTGQYIYNKGQIVGMFFIGRDLSFYYNTIKRLLFILLGLLVVFLFVASVIGSFMAKRAMIPISETYQRQRLFVADASHELRTPLSVLQASIEVLEADEKRNISEFSNNILIDMKDEVRSMKKLVTDLLDLARSDSGVYGLNNEVFDFNNIADQILRTTKALGNSRNIEISLKSENPLIVYGDKEKLKQLIYILLDNAIKYSYDKGKIIVSLYKTNIKDKSYICIKVQDFGIGIGASQHDRIFDRFYRDDKNRTRETGGTGLGLAIAKSIVEAHNGRIEVASTPKKGSVFTVCIPNKDMIKGSK
jgi:signal transduction histidine kinase